MPYAQRRTRCSSNSHVEGKADDQSGDSRHAHSAVRGEERGAKRQLNSIELLDKCVWATWPHRGRRELRDCRESDFGEQLPNVAWNHSSRDRGCGGHRFTLAHLIQAFVARCPSLKLCCRQVGSIPTRNNRSCRKPGPSQRVDVSLSDSEGKSRALS